MRIWPFKQTASLETKAATSGTSVPEDWMFELFGGGVVADYAVTGRKAELAAAVRAADVGDLVVVTNPPSWMPPDDIRQIIQGATETIDTVLHTIRWSGAPASAYDVGVWDDADARYESWGSWLAAPTDADDTTITVRTPQGPLWGTGDLPYDVAVGGERMTVTAVVGSSSPQTFTVTRSVNGVVKSHREGTEVRLWRPVYLGL